MSTIAITAAHFASLPARFLVGRWSNIPTSTLLAFNALDIGLNTLIRGISTYVIKSRNLNFSKSQMGAFNLSVRLLTFLTAMYVTSRLTHPMPVGYAALTNLVAIFSIHASLSIGGWISPKK
jgi:hypothetical protein